MIWDEKARQKEDEGLRNGTLRMCPKCLEIILRTSPICEHCNTNLEELGYWIKK